MNDQEIVALAVRCRLTPHHRCNRKGDYFMGSVPALQSFAAAIAERERAACLALPQSEGPPVIADVLGEAEKRAEQKLTGWEPAKDWLKRTPPVPASADRVRVTDNALLTEAAARIVDIWMGGDTAWRSRIDDSEFLESADWIAAVRLATAALSATPEHGRVETSLYSIEGLLHERNHYRAAYFAALAPRATTDHDGGPTP